MSSFDFVEKVMTIGGAGNEVPTLQFYKKGFVISSGSVEPTWRDIILSGNTALTLVNAKADGINYLKLFGGTEQRNLPSEYTQVEYLESSGTQYINTGIPVSDDLTFGYKVAPKNANQLSISQLRPSPWGRSGLIVWQSGDYINICYISVRSTFTTTTNVHYEINQVFDIIFNDNNNFYIDDSLVYTKTNTIDTSGVLVTGVFDTAYSLWAKIDGVLVFNGIPCRRNSDNELGMYDTVTGNFLTNQGTGTFTAGADVTPSPDTPMDIWCNNGVLKFGALGKNLFNPTKVLFGYYRDRTTGIKQQSSSNFMSSDDGYIPCLPNTTYTFVGTNKTNGTYSKYNTIYLFDSAKNYLGASSYEISQPTTATTPNDCYYLQVRSNPLDNSTPIQDAFAQFDWQLEQGSTATPYEPYRAGIYTDGTVETVEITGKNLFDKDNNLLIGYYINNTTGQINKSSDGSSSCFLNYLPSSSNITYTMSSENISRNTAMRMWAYDKDKNPISAVFNSTTLNTSISGTTPEGTAYIRCSFGTIPEYRNNIQLEQGSTATEYEPYFNGGQATAEMLLKVGNYQDIQSVLDGNVTRNVGIKTFDGTEDWHYISGYYNISKTYIGSDSTVLPSGSTDIICTHYETIGGVPNRTSVNVGGSYINFRDDNVSTLADWKQYLADQYANGTPVILVYPLATATTETVTPQPLTIQAGTNIITAEGSIDNLPLEVSYKAGVRVTITEVQNAQLDNNVEVTING